MGHAKNIEKELIKGLKMGVEHSYVLLFEKYYNGLCNYVYKLSQDYDLSKDLVQNVLVRFWEKRAFLSIETSLQNYLLRSCHNEFLMYVRKQKREYGMIEELRWEAIYEANVNSEVNVLEEKWQSLSMLIETLPNKCKEVFKLSRLEQKKHKEISELLGISTKTVEVHITKALKIIRAQAKN